MTKVSGYIFKGFMMYFSIGQQTYQKFIWTQLFYDILKPQLFLTIIITFCKCFDFNCAFYIFFQNAELIPSYGSEELTSY